MADITGNEESNTLELTGRPDLLRALGGDDLIVGDVTGALETADEIDGGAGFDTLRSVVEQNGTQAPTISNVEDIFVDTGGLAFDISSISGAERIVADGASVTFTQIGSEDLDVRFGASGVNVGQVVLDFLSSDLPKTFGIKLEAIDANTTFRAPTSKENRSVREVDLVVSGNQVPFGEDGDVQVDLSAFNRLETLILSGEANAKVQIGSKKIDLVDASATTGGITLNSDIGNGQTIIGGSGGDDFKTGNGGDVIETGAGDDTVNAGSGDNDVSLGAGADVYEGEGGNDSVDAGTGADDIKTGGGNDTVAGGSGDDVIDGEGGEDDLSGGDGDDTIDGGNNDDVIRDGAGDDVVFGGGGEDLLIAGAGDDVFDGGAGDDMFDFVTGSDLGNDQVGDSNKFAIGSDTAELLVGGTVYSVSTRDEWRTLNQQQDAAVVVDAGAQTVEVDIDNGGIVTFNVNDADFFAMS